MTSWEQFSAAAPELARRVEPLFSSHRHHTMATLRRDGAPRISGTEVEFVDGQLVLGMMPGTRRAADLRRDPRLALHSHSTDPVEDDAAAWPGEAKVSGRAVALPGAEGDPDRFRVDVEQVVFTHLGTPADHLLIESWSPASGLVTHRRD